MAGNNEQELCFYAEVTQPEGYKEALSLEQHEQWEYRIPDSKNRTRVRKTICDSIVEYTMTIKEKREGFGDTESTSQINQALFESFIRSMATSGCNKIRYTYLAKKVKASCRGESFEGSLTYEIDVFLDKAGNRSKFVKIDVEVQDILTQAKARWPDATKYDFDIRFENLPLGITTVFSAVDEREEVKSQIAQFWEKFNLKPKAE